VVAGTERSEPIHHDDPVDEERTAAHYMRQMGKVTVRPGDRVNMTYALTFHLNYGDSLEELAEEVRIKAAALAEAFVSSVIYVNPEESDNARNAEDGAGVGAETARERLRQQ
jgi:hypothetical protein